MRKRTMLLAAATALVTAASLGFGAGAGQKLAPDGLRCTWPDDGAFMCAPMAKFTKPHHTLRRAG